jgi:hypothetical protein
MAQRANSISEAGTNISRHLRIIACRLVFLCWLLPTDYLAGLRSVANELLKLVAG